MPRAVWKGTLQVGDVQCGVALFTATSTSERIAFHTINRATGHRVHREFVDIDTGKPVSRDDQVKGYDTGDATVMLEPDEIAAVLPDNTKTIAVDRFLACEDIDTLFFDRPYYLTASEEASNATLALLRDGLRQKKVAALGTALLFRRVHTLLIRPDGDGLVATLLKFDEEVRSADDAFADLKKVTITDEMRELAVHIIKTKAGRFDPKRFDDRYEEAVAEMVKAKAEGRSVKARPAPAATNPVDLLAALRESAKAGKPRRAAVHSKAKGSTSKPKRSGTAAPRRKAG